MIKKTYFSILTLLTTIAVGASAGGNYNDHSNFYISDATLIIFLALSAVVSVLLFVIFFGSLYHLFKSKLQPLEKIAYLFLILLTNMVGVIIYYLIEVRPHHKKGVHAHAHTHAEKAE